VGAYRFVKGVGEQLHVVYEEDDDEFPKGRLVVLQQQVEDAKDRALDLLLYLL
jgi:hypothetical protein